MKLRALATYFNIPAFKSGCYDYAKRAGLTFSNLNYQILDRLIGGDPARLDVILAAIEAINELNDKEISALRSRASSVYPLSAVILQSLRTSLLSGRKGKN